jgi:hypothetical protein
VRLVLPVVETKAAAWFARWHMRQGWLEATQ